MILHLQKRYHQGLYEFRFTTGHKGSKEGMIDELTREKEGNRMPEKTLQGSYLSQYLSLAGFLMNNKKLFMIVRHSPELDEIPGAFFVGNFLWRYEVLANDFDGNGVDHQFVETVVPYTCLAIGSPSIAEKFSEDNLEEEYSNVTLFGLRRDPLKRLADFFNWTTPPRIEDLLEADEVFVNIVCGKKYGYFNAFLAKSPVNLDPLFNEYKNSMEADN